jgi:predicted solute-binding protein
VSELSLPAGLRVGAVSYLNTKPLIRGFESGSLLLDVPSRLSALFLAGELDAALLPIFEILRTGGGTFVDDVAIACRGPVFSVLVASQCDFAECGTIYLDPSSRSSAALLTALVAEYHPQIQVVEGIAPENAARLIIGDPAIRFRNQHGEAWRYHDLGAIWQEHTGLPFVFAAWALAPRLPGERELADLFRASKRLGVAQTSAIAAEEADTEFAQRYLTEFIHFDLGNEEKSAIEKFAELALKHRLIESKPSLRFV